MAQGIGCLGCHLPTLKVSAKRAARAGLNLPANQAPLQSGKSSSGTASAHPHFLKTDMVGTNFRMQSRFGDILCAMARYEDCPLLFLIAYSAGKSRQIDETLDKNVNALKVAQNLWLCRAETDNAASDIRGGLLRFLNSGDSLTVARLTTDDFAWDHRVASLDSVKAIFAGIHQ